MRTVLTDRMLRAMKPAPVGTRLDIMDAIVPGLGLRVTDKGQRTFILRARFPGSSNPTRRAIGEYGRITLETARSTARAWHELIAEGLDPREHARLQRETKSLTPTTTFGVVAEEYLHRHVRGQRRGADVERVFQREILPRWRERPVAEIGRRDVVGLIDAIADRGARYQAHTVLGHVRAFYNWAINRGIYGLEASPCDRLKPNQLLGRREPRLRVLNDAELAALWRATERMGYPYGNLYRLLLLTGQRKLEVARARWSEFDVGARIWTIPAERFKSNAVHVVPLSNDVLAALSALPRFENGDFLFSVSFGKRPVANFDTAKLRLDELMLEELNAPLTPFVVHDLRRTVRTRLSALRVAEPVAEMVIGHARKGLARVYDQHRYLDEMREALELWAQTLRTIVRSP